MLASPPSEEFLHDVFTGGGEMGAVMRSFDWAATPLGPPETWCPTLQIMTRMLLNNSFPILLWWGPDFIQLYNDAYVPVLGDKHPDRALGKPFRECWSEVYHILGPLAEGPFQGGPPTWIEDIPVELNRYAYKEEAHFTISYSPVPDPTAPRGIGGVVAIVHEISAKIVGDRHILALRDLAARSAEAKSAGEECAAAARTLAAYRKDVPFALVYLLDDKGDLARLAGKAETENCEALCPETVRLGDEPEVWPFETCLKKEEIVVVDDLAGRFGDVPAGPWADPPNMAAVVPIPSQIPHQPAGFLISGISSRLKFGDGYRGFLELASAQIGTSIANARAYEMERRRNEALAELDRAKTTFFSNVSHELRTPLTLILGPIEDMLAEPGGFAAADRERLELAHRNSIRLLKLVNTLLDFSRIEAGRIQASFEPIELAAYTAELASVFRSTIERAGLRLDVDCSPLSEPVYVDREMWEKIIFNLLSNAFKFTFAGAIVVSVRTTRDGAAEVSVSDTGTGIPAEELPELFKRFHRVRGAKGRSYEGSGIGLALVQELVKMHGGSIAIESEIGRGSKFVITIPLGTAHLPPERIGAPREPGSAALISEAIVQETERWLANVPAAGIDVLPLNGAMKASESAAKRELLVIADDNTDMRDYLRRLLERDYDVVAVSDGVQAIAQIEQLHPGLVITDVMMPGVDGFGVLRAVRSHPELHETPVILLSARAGEESRVEGLSAGADDYIVKPLHARELLARVQSHLALFRLRKEAEAEVRRSEMRFRALVEATSEAVYQMSSDWTVMRRLVGRQFIADTESPDRSWLERYVLPEDRPAVMAAVEKAIRTKSNFELEHRVVRADGSPGWVMSRAVPLIDAHGNITEWFGAAIDITARKQAERALLQSERLASLGRMAATIAHEINNPLEALTNLLYLAEKTNGLPVNARELLEKADTELRRVAHITRQSLGFYRETVAPAPVEVSMLIESAIDLLKGKIESKRATVERQWRTSEKVTAVAGELRQVFSNLIANGLDAIEDGGVIKIRTSTYTGPTGQRRMRITIADSGKGIEPASRAHIFEPLYTTKSDIGTGLGLWVTKQIMEKHRGTIQIRSCVGGKRTGSTFSLTLPL